MKSNRKRIVTAVVFSVTLVLGVTALVLAWRLQQEKQISEEEVSAGCQTANWCLGEQGSCGGDYNSGMGHETKCYGHDGHQVLSPSKIPNIPLSEDPCRVRTTTDLSLPNINGNLVHIGYTSPKDDQWLGVCAPGIEGQEGVYRPVDGIPVNDERLWCTTMQADKSLPDGRNEYRIIWIGDQGDACWDEWTAGGGFKKGCNAPYAGFRWSQGGAKCCDGIECNSGDCAFFSECDTSTCTVGASSDVPHYALDWNCKEENPSFDCTSKTGDKTNVNPGQNITYTVNYTSENITAGDLWVFDKLDSDVEFVSFDAANPACGAGNTLSPGCCTYNTQTNPDFPTQMSGGHFIACQPSNMNGNVKYTVKAKNSVTTGTIANQAYVGTDITDSEEIWELDETGCAKSISINSPEAICTGKSINDENEIDPGQNVTFTINYQNNGAVNGSILITDVVPNGFENVTTTTPGCTASGNTATCTIPNVVAGATGTVTITAKAKSNIRDLNTNNTATVRLDINGDGIPDDTAPDAVEIEICSTEPSTSVAGAQCVNKVDNVETFVNPGDVITYTIGYKALRTPATIHITDEMPQYTTLYTSGSCALPTDCSASTSTKLDCTFDIAQALPTYENVLAFCVKVDETGIPLDGVNIENTKVKVWEGNDEPEEFDETCTEETEVEHVAPSCDFTTPSVMTIRVADLVGTTVSLVTTGILGTHSDLDFIWTATGGTLSSTIWHASSGTPANGRVIDTILWAPPTDAEDTDTFDIKVYVSPTGIDHTAYVDPATDPTAYTDEDCESTTTITALDLICNWMVPNNSFEFLPFDMTFKADIGGDQGALFTYDLNYGDGTTHYTGSGTVAAGTTVELPYVPPQATPHTYNSTTPITYNPVLTVTNTETGETSICPTVLGGRTQSEWSIVKDSDVDTCVAVNTTVTYSIVVTNTGDYTADLAQVRDTVDAKIDTSTITNIRECDSNGLNCTTYNRTDVLSGRTITWPGRTYTAGESRKYMYTVSINTGGDYYNVAEAIPETGETVRDDELFPTCAGKAPATGAISTTVYIAILGMLIVAGGYYTYRTAAGAQIVANVMGKTSRSVRRNFNRKETFERDSIRSEKDKSKR